MRAKIFNLETRCATGPWKRNERKKKKKRGRGGVVCLQAVLTCRSYAALCNKSHTRLLLLLLLCTSGLSRRERERERERGRLQVWTYALRALLRIFDLGRGQFSRTAD